MRNFDDRGWGPRNDLPDDGGGEIGHDVNAGRQAKTGRAGLGLQLGLRAIQTARSPAKANKASAAPPKCCRVARVDTCRAVDGSTVPKLGYARLPILCLCLGRVTHAGQIDARLCVFALGRVLGPAWDTATDAKTTTPARSLRNCAILSSRVPLRPRAGGLRFGN